MGRKTSPTLTDSELRLMRIAWDLGSCTVNDVVDALPEDGGLAYSTVLTTLRILENKGYLTHTQRGRAYVYTPVKSPGQVRQGALQYVLDRFFDNSPSLLMLNLLQEDNLSEDDVEEIRNLLADSEEDEK